MVRRRSPGDFSLRRTDLEQPNIPPPDKDSSRAPYHNAKSTEEIIPKKRLGKHIARYCENGSSTDDEEIIRNDEIDELSRAFCERNKEEHEVSACRIERSVRLIIDDFHYAVASSLGVVVATRPMRDIVRATDHGSVFSSGLLSIASGSFTCIMHFLETINHF
ncbi:uncharacterized protein LOC144469056 isoform X2 [Augochlora pura]